MDSLLKDCNRCEMPTALTKILGHGSLTAGVCFLGRSPGIHDTPTSGPFQGYIGQILEQGLGIAKLNREEIWLTNLLKCQGIPINPGLARYYVNCHYWLNHEFKQLKQLRYIVTLGTQALQCFSKGRVNEMHGQVFDWGFYRIFPTYHPGAASRDPLYRSLFFDDMKRLAKELPHE